MPMAERVVVASVSFAAVDMMDWKVSGDVVVDVEMINASITSHAPNAESFGDAKTWARPQLEEAWSTDCFSVASDNATDFSTTTVKDGELQAILMNYVQH
jgi:hypothetical protein